MITLTMERLDHAVVLKLPTDHEHVMVALWRLRLNRDPHMYTLGELNAERKRGYFKCRTLQKLMREACGCKKSCR